MVRLLEKSQTPPGGWKFRYERSGMVFKHYDYGSFIGQIMGHIRANGFPETVEEIEVQICGQMQLPDGWCGEPPPPSNAWSGVGLRDLWRGLNSAAQIIASGMAFVGQEEANRRAAICAGCQFNLEHTDCLACTGFSDALRQFLGSRRTARDRDLKACSICKCGLREKVWLPLSSIDNSGLDYPTWCWQSPGLGQVGEPDNKKEQPDGGAEDLKPGP